MMETFPDIPHNENQPKLTLSNPAEANLPVEESDLEKLMNRIEKEENVLYQSVELVYVDEDYIVEINREYLNREYVTDIISFRYDEDTSDRVIEGTLFCCAARITEQCGEANTTPRNEFYRVFVHGLLHLAGYNDQSEKEKETMTRLENHYLNYINTDS